MDDPAHYRRSDHPKYFVEYFTAETLVIRFLSLLLAGVIRFIFLLLAGVLLEIVKLACVCQSGCKYCGNRNEKSQPVQRIHLILPNITI
jgi:hypothetical protein